MLTLVYALNIADRLALSTLIEPIKQEFGLSDGAVGFLTGVSLAIFYVTAGLPLGRLADIGNRRKILLWSIFLWSLATASCGATRTFFQLLIARIGVGIGEAGGTPASHSMLADMFPPRRRLIAMSVYALGVPLGMAFGAIGTGWCADRFGWRSGLILLGACGMPILLMVLTLREPPRGDGHPVVAVTLHDALGFIARQKALIHILLGASIATFAGTGLVWWTPAFLMRAHHMTVGQAGLEIGLMGGVGGGIATVLSVPAMILLARCDVRWQCYLLALICVLLTASGIAAHLVRDRSLCLMLLWAFVPFANLYVGPTLALIQNLSAPSVRGLTVAILLFWANVANLVLAPQLLGWLSDALAPLLGGAAEGLRGALVVGALTGLWAAWHFVAAIRTLAGDLDRAEAHCAA